MKRPKTKLVLLLALVSIALIAVGPGPKHEEILCLMFKTAVLCFFAVAVAPRWSRSLALNSAGVMAAVGSVWWATILLVTERYNYSLYSMGPAFKLSLYAVTVSGIIAALSTALRRFLVTVSHPEHPLCSQCGYDLRGLNESRCPECGKPF